MAETYHVRASVQARALDLNMGLRNDKKLRGFKQCQMPVSDNIRYAMRGHRNVWKPHVHVLANVWVVMMHKFVR